MEYIVLDLEWDSAYFVPEKRFINQILQIGAVKLDDDFRVVDTFERTVKSAISKRVTGRFSALTGITNEDMRNGVPLYTAVKEYNEWVGENAVTMTWSDSDLYTVLENERCLLKGVRFKIENYLDLQTFIQNEMRIRGFEINSQISLSAAATTLQVTLDGYDMHTAKDDSLVCAKLLKKCYNKERFEALIKNTGETKLFDRLSFKPIYVNDINSKLIDKSYLEFCCDVCNNRLIRKSKWNYKNRWFVARFECLDCKKKFLCRVSVRQNYDSTTVKRKLSEFKKKTVKNEEKKDELQPMSSKM